MTNNDTKHTPEPWKVWHNLIGDPCIKSIWENNKGQRCTTFVAECLDAARCEDDAKRIVATVNFCESFTNSELAEMGGLKELKSNHDTFKNAFKLSKELADDLGKELEEKYYPEGLPEEYTSEGYRRVVWHPFNEGEPETHPKKEEPYLVRYNKDDPEFQFDVCRWTDFGKLKIDGKKIGFGWRGNPYQDSVVKFYQPITPPKDK